MNTGITLFLNDEEITTGDYLLECREERAQMLGKHEGDGPKDRLELEVKVTNCHTDLTEGNVSVSFFGVVFDAVVRSRDTKFTVNENWPNLHNFSVVLLPQPRITGATPCR